MTMFCRPRKCGRAPTGWVEPYATYGGFSGVFASGAVTQESLGLLGHLLLHSLEGVFAEEQLAGPAKVKRQRVADEPVAGNHVALGFCAVGLGPGSLGETARRAAPEMDAALVRS